MTQEVLLCTTYVKLSLMSATDCQASQLQETQTACSTAPLSSFPVFSPASLVALSLKDKDVPDSDGLLSRAGLESIFCNRYAERLWPDPAHIAVQAVAVCAAEAKAGGAYIAVVTEPAAPLPEVADVEEDTELADEAPIAPPGQLLHDRAPCHLSSCSRLGGPSKQLQLQLLSVNSWKSSTEPV